MVKIESIIILSLFIGLSFCRPRSFLETVGDLFLQAGLAGLSERCASCPSLEAKSCPLLTKCNECTETILTPKANEFGCLEMELTCPRGSHVILVLTNGHAVSRQATTLGSFVCHGTGQWYLHSLNYTERNVVSASCYRAAPDRQESPIDIRSQDASRDSNLVHMSVDYARNQGDSISWGGNETTFIVKARDGDSSSSEWPWSIFKSLFGQTSEFSASQTDGVSFELYAMHAHWGTEGMDGSEHLIDGRRYLAEFHFVHYNPEYGTFDNAVGKRNGIAVIAVFAELGPENREFGKVVRAIESLSRNQIEHNEDHEEYTIDHLGFNFDKLIPGKPYEFLTYTGSLTTGDFNTCVDWTVMRRPITLSQAQMSALYLIFQNNFRAPQPILKKTTIRKNFD